MDVDESEEKEKKEGKGNRGGLERYRQDMRVSTMNGK